MDNATHTGDNNTAAQDVAGTSQEEMADAVKNKIKAAEKQRLQKECTVSSTIVALFVNYVC